MQKRMLLDPCGLQRKGILECKILMRTAGGDSILSGIALLRVVDLLLVQHAYFLANV